MIMKTENRDDIQKFTARLIISISCASFLARGGILNWYRLIVIMLSLEHGQA